MKTKIFSFLLIISLGKFVFAQEENVIPLPQNLEDGYPRMYLTQKEKGGLERLIKEEEWAQNVLNKIHQKVDEHVFRHVEDPEWMVSR